ncbi:glycosyltransferase family 2 protein [Bailinhaonella thermotolerans]|uniref:Glycosyltransferase n=1 Tax=Bailinhaonella thermotolerans TaxID=1070861 RepID=A0A3A4AY94_9ACTN|nr:glycosyltransferase [Bailinhaonella thermotolerans]RJL30813.1 glycosyltransferase [Bailinhaonella thermotolerans]
MAGPLVSVIIAVYNAEPFLRECLDSVLAQSIGHDRMEVIAVDDGSRDAGGAILDEYAERHPGVVRVVHQENSGGPSRPRNVGLDIARGTYVFFLDADDYLGTEALERMVAMAERNDSDVVLGKMVGVGGRSVPKSMFTVNRDRADLFKHGVYNTLSPTKLFRRELIERLGLRFPENVRSGEDQPFTARVYFNAKVISVVADYPCYYATHREGHVSATQSPIHPLERMPQTAEVMELVAGHTDPGENRDRLMLRHIRLEVLSRFNLRWAEWPPEEREAVFNAAKPLIDAWHTDWIQERLGPWDRLRAYCLRHGLLPELTDIALCPAYEAEADVTVEDGRVFAGYPHFRDGSGIPDECFELTHQVKARHWLEEATIDGPVLYMRGHAYLSVIGVDGGEVEIVLRDPKSETEHRFPVVTVDTPDLKPSRHAYPHAGFRVAIDLATAGAGRPLPRGTWNISVSIESRGLRKTVRLGPKRAPETASNVTRGQVRRGFLRDSAHLSYDGKGNLRLTIAQSATTQKAKRVARRYFSGIRRLMARSGSTVRQRSS